MSTTILNVCRPEIRGAKLLTGSTFKIRYTRILFVYVQWKQYKTQWMWKGYFMVRASLSIMKSATKWTLFFAVQVNKGNISRGIFHSLFTNSFNRICDLSFVFGCGYYGHAFNFHPSFSSAHDFRFVFRFMLWCIFASFVQRNYGFLSVWYIVGPLFLSLFASRYWIWLNAYIHFH